MTEAQTKCAVCGAPILQRTADKYDGLCGRCHGQAASIPPGDFNIPEALVERLNAIGEQSGDYRRLVWLHGSKFLDGFIDKKEEQIALYQEWLPKLREFAENCRHSQPSIPDDSLSCREREKQRIFRTKFDEQPPLYRIPNTVAICSMPIIAISVAERIWPQGDSGPVLLTPEEKSRWDRIYKHAEESFWWSADYSWSIDDAPEPRYYVGDEIDLPDGGAPWFVTVGQISGPLAGAGHTELWSWNGRTATFVRIIEEWIS